MLCHVNDSYLACMGERKVSPATGVFQQTIMKWVALRVPLPWPHGVATRPEVEQGVGGTPPAKFEGDRAQLLATVKRFAARDCKFSPHPIFGAMSADDWMRWGYLHADHHLRQFGF
jgi:hypothetical protein